MDQTIRQDLITRTVSAIKVQRREPMIYKIRSFLISVFGMAMSIATSILVMIYGWGVTPKSWWWIVGVYLVGNIVALSIIEAAKLKE